ncbi:MAG: hypothetical protein HY210_00520 [Candidatus Omnitrophica bacterium]|nr:hypothetical protein [Candidatus Omnitrophota bacterium]
MRKKVISFMLSVGLFFLLSNSAQATLKSYKLFKEVYPGKDTAYYSCVICHLGKVGKKGELNPYGQGLGLAEKENLTEEKLKAVENLDPDGDGVPSGKEIEAGTLPGDAGSVPDKR